MALAWQDLIAFCLIEIVRDFLGQASNVKHCQYTTEFSKLVNRFDLISKYPPIAMQSLINSSKM